PVAVHGTATGPPVITHTPPAPGDTTMNLPFDDEHAALFTVGQVAAMLQVQQAFLRRIDDHQVVSPQRSIGGQRRYSRHEIGRIQQVVIMMDQGMTLPAIRLILDLRRQLIEITQERDELARELAELQAKSATARRTKATGSGDQPRH
ncbi:MerR family transcriptional regulator, partial [Nonomuraea sp. JJY05]|uniref:MerR family transcriptional regulator n=1 Tax=Nonomuraea sp. JJY05 TaxID=3350255 RepID=UPI00373DFBDA